jgi:hypothetical protein
MCTSIIHRISTFNIIYKWARESTYGLLLQISSRYKVYGVRLDEIETDDIFSRTELHQAKQEGQAQVLRILTAYSGKREQPKYNSKSKRSA